MTVYTYSEARQHLAEILDKARTEGAVQIRRRDGSMFQVTPVEHKASPLDGDFCISPLMPCAA